MLSGALSQAWEGCGDVDISAENLMVVRAGCGVQNLCEVARVMADGPQGHHSDHVCPPLGEECSSMCSADRRRQLCM